MRPAAERLPQKSAISRRSNPDRTAAVPCLPGVLPRLHRPKLTNWPSVTPAFRFRQPRSVPPWLFNAAEFHHSSHPMMGRPTAPGHRRTATLSWPRHTPDRALNSHGVPLAKGKSSASQSYFKRQSRNSLHAQPPPLPVLLPRRLRRQPKALPLFLPRALPLRGLGLAPKPVPPCRALLGALAATHEALLLSLAA